MSETITEGGLGVGIVDDDDEREVIPTFPFPPLFILYIHSLPPIIIRLSDLPAASSVVPIRALRSRREVQQRRQSLASSLVVGAVEDLQETDRFFSGFIL